jgi:hypothetical protein
MKSGVREPLYPTMSDVDYQASDDNYFYRLSAS